jgi:cell division protein FtsB
MTTTNAPQSLAEVRDALASEHALITRRQYVDGKISDGDYVETEMARHFKFGFDAAITELQKRSSGAHFDSTAALNKCLSLLDEGAREAHKVLTDAPLGIASAVGVAMARWADEQLRPRVSAAEMMKEAAQADQHVLDNANIRLNQKVAALESEFKNFHRMICEAAVYGHDETDWKRDQASLAELVRGLRGHIDALEADLSCEKQNYKGATEALGHAYRERDELKAQNEKLEAEVKRLHALHLERTKLTEKVINENELLWPFIEAIAKNRPFPMEDCVEAMQMWNDHKREALSGREEGGGEE